MKSFGLKASPLALLVLTLPSFLSAQSAVKTIEWETLRPDGEDFSVQMPKGSTAQSGKEPYHKFELNTNTYISQIPNGPVFAVVSLSGIKSNPAMYTEAERLNSYVDAFKNLFPPKLRKRAVAKLTLVGQFFSSFLIPEKLSQPATVAAQNPPVEAASADAPASGDVPAETPTANGGEANDAARARKRGPLAGGVLNGKAIILPQPEYPAAAKAAGAAGTVVVRITIDEQGNVISAVAVSGPPTLQSASINAALQAKFAPTLLVGEPVQVIGIITYNFIRQ